jgi:hypothetical protein
MVPTSLPFFRYDWKRDGGWNLLFALFGAGVTAIVIALASSLASTWVYGALQSRLPH